jgi:phosphinothricin acetyltransferase
MKLTPRAAHVDDAAAIAAIYNEGITDRIATFETEPRSAEHVDRWFDGRHPIVVVEGDGGVVLAFASTSTYRDRACYVGIAEFSVYVARGRRGTGAGRVAMAALIDAATKAGFWKLISRIFPENTASLALMARMGFREVGVYQRHGKLDGRWRDCVIVERLLGDAAAAGSLTSRALRR